MPKEKFPTSSSPEQPEGSEFEKAEFSLPKQEQVESPENLLESKHNGWMDKAKGFLKDASIASGVSLATILGMRFGLKALFGPEAELPPSLEAWVGGGAGLLTIFELAQKKSKKKSESELER